MSGLKSVLVEVSAAAAWRQLVPRYSLRETGGILLGSYQSETAVVSYVTGPGRKARRTFWSVAFDHEHLQAEQDRLMDDEPSLCFLGDWHYHPWGRGQMSRTDMETLLSLRIDEEYLLGGRAITLILTSRRGRFDPRAYGWEGSDIVELPVRQRYAGRFPVQ